MPSIFCFPCYNLLKTIATNGNLLQDPTTHLSKPYSALNQIWDKSSDMIEWLSKTFMKEYGESETKGTEKETTASERTMLGHEVVRLVDKGTVKKCSICETVETAGAKLLACARCQTTWYCSKVCQKADWKKHKPTCKEPLPDLP